MNINKGIGIWNEMHIYNIYYLLLSLSFCKTSVFKLLLLHSKVPLHKFT